MVMAAAWPPAAVIKRSKTRSSGARRALRVWAPGRSGDRNGPSKWMPRMFGAVPSSMAAAIASAAAIICSSSAVAIEASIPVVPRSRCARATTRTSSIFPL